MMTFGIYNLLVIVIALLAISVFLPTVNGTSSFLCFYVFERVCAFALIVLIVFV